MRNAKKIVLLVALTAGTTMISVTAMDIRWKGGAVAKPNNWNIAKNWSVGTIPAASDSVNVNVPPKCEISGGKTASVKMLKVGCSGKFIGSLNIQGKDSSLTAGSMTVGGYGGYGRGIFTQSSGTVTIAKGLSFGHGAAAGYGKYHGTGGKLTVGSMTVGAGYTTATKSGNGEFHIDGAAVSVAKFIYNGLGKMKGLGRGNGAINISAGSLRVAGSFFNSHHMWAKPLPEGKKHCGRLTVSGGRLDVTGIFYNGFGPRSGDTSQIEGVLEVIGSGSKITIGKDFTQIEGSTLVAELAGKNHTVIRVKGNVTLGGTFKVRLRKGYKPSSGTWWNIIQAGVGSPIGTFSKLDFSAMPDPDAWKVRYDTDNCVFRVGYFGK